MTSSSSVGGGSEVAKARAPPHTPSACFLLKNVLHREHAERVASMPQDKDKSHLLAPRALGQHSSRRQPQALNPDRAQLPHSPHTSPHFIPNTHLRAVPFGSTPLAARPEPSPPTLNSMPVPSTRVALLSFSVSSRPSNPSACKRGRGKGGGEAHAQATRKRDWTGESGDRARW